MVPLNKSPDSLWSQLTTPGMEEMTEKGSSEGGGREKHSSEAWFLGEESEMNRRSFRVKGQRTMEGHEGSEWKESEQPLLGRISQREQSSSTLAEWPALDWRFIQIPPSALQKANCFHRFPVKKIFIPNCAGPHGFNGFYCHVCWKESQWGALILGTLFFFS